MALFSPRFDACAGIAMTWICTPDLLDRLVSILAYLLFLKVMTSTCRFSPQLVNMVLSWRFVASR